ncbi:XkdF-like putative serine protease domain-containing protein [Bacillus cereus group sp. Bc253]|uniref:XkdF-like putative serine protease domain-containing protein n=1 Tax=Bacillus cereus group sp. Bc253 TaxID=3018103 RepID=UPI0022E493B2|nr:XkdF-like putative serine protease domain-containing protein [Bacillus cereus group sp. Bc253]MDA2157899.1 XkdF-like putative serine protease domain-containing protein [Bacillus cereus group sp. Bc253]
MPNELKNVEISYVSLVTKGANGRPFAIMKGMNMNSSNVLKNVPILKREDEKQLVTGVVYEPNIEDAHGDIMTAEEIERAAYNFLEKYRYIDKNHDELAGKGTVVESWISKNNTVVGKQNIKKGTWLMTVRVDDSETWKEIKKGKITGFSMGGVGERMEMPQMDEFTQDERGVIRKMFNFFKSHYDEEQTQEMDNQSLNRKQNSKMQKVFNLFEDVFYVGIWEGNVDIKQMVSTLDEMKDILNTMKGGDTDFSPEDITINSINEVGKILYKKNDKKFDEMISLMNQIKENKLQKNADQNSDEIADMVKREMGPFLERLQDLEEQLNKELESTHDTNELENDRESKKTSEFIQKVIDPISKRLEVIERSAQVRKSLGPDTKPTNEMRKPVNKWVGLDL